MTVKAPRARAWFTDCTPPGSPTGRYATRYPPMPPTVTTGDTSQVGPTAVRVHGVVNPQGQDTTWYVEYGQTTSYGLQTPPQSAGSGTSDVAVRTVVGDLHANTTYHYRVVAKNSAGTIDGSDNTFTVSAPVSSGPPPPSVSQVAFLGHMGFVSGRYMAGLATGCFNGDMACIGRLTIRVASNNRLIGQKNISIRARSGSFQNLRISRYGARLMFRHGSWRLLRVSAQITTSSGPSVSRVMTLARWIGH
jgi:hypothetical protein